MSASALELVGLRRRPAPAAAPGATVVRAVTTRATGRAGLVLLTLVAAFLVVVPLASSQDVYAQDGVQLQAPSRQHLLGTDQVGRDVLVRLADGGRRSLGGALAALAAAVLGGLVVGVTAASGNRRVDGLLMRAVDALNGLPPLVIPIALVGALGATYTNLLLAIVVSYVPSYARIARSFAEGLRTRLDIVAAGLLGVSRTRIAATHVLPAVLTQMLVIATLDVGAVIVSLSGLSFLGLGAQAPTPEWGVLLGDGQMFFTPAPWLLVAPAAAMTVVVAGANLVGEAMRDGLAEQSGR